MRERERTHSKGSFRVNRYRFLYSCQNKGKNLADSHFKMADVGAKLQISTMLHLKKKYFALFTCLKYLNTAHGLVLTLFI